VRPARCYRCSLSVGLVGSGQNSSWQAVDGQVIISVEGQESFLAGRDWMYALARKKAM